MRKLLLLVLLLLVTMPGLQPPRGFNLEGLLPSAGEQTVSGRMVQIILVVTMLSVAPGLLMMVTCFTRFVIVLDACCAPAWGCRPRLRT